MHVVEARRRMARDRRRSCSSADVSRRSKSARARLVVEVGASRRIACSSIDMIQRVLRQPRRSMSSRVAAMSQCSRRDRAMHPVSAAVCDAIVHRDDRVERRRECWHRATSRTACRRRSQPDRSRATGEPSVRIASVASSTSTAGPRWSIRCRRTSPRSTSGRDACVEPTRRPFARRDRMAVGVDDAFGP